jgi:hypothetical protein
MKTLVVQFTTDDEYLRILDILNNMKIKSKTISEEDAEDFGLIELMKDVDRTDKVSREEIMFKLGIS